MRTTRPSCHRPLLFFAVIGATLAVSTSITAGQVAASTSASVLPLTISSTDSAVTASQLKGFTYRVTTMVDSASAPSSYVWDFALPFGASLQLLPSGSVAVIRPQTPGPDVGGMTQEELAVAQTLFSQERNRDPDPPVPPQDEQAAAALDTYEPEPELPGTGPDPESSTDEPMSPETWDPLTAPDDAAEGDYFDDPAYSPADWNPIDGSDSSTLLSAAQETADGEVVAVVAEPTAADAIGQAVPSRLAVDGSKMTLTIDHNLSTLYAYPVTARSLVTEDEDLETNAQAPAAQCERYHYGRVNTWNPFGWDILVAKLAQFPAKCTRYYIAIPPVATNPPVCLPRGDGVPAQIRALNQLPQVINQGASFHALAEFNWGRCGMDDPETDPVAVARQFRSDMAARGYDVAKQETWAINEIPCPVRESSWWRNRVRTLVNTLYNGGGDLALAPGVVYMVWKQQSNAHEDRDRRCPAQETFSQYKTFMKDWTLRGAFWQRMRTPNAERRVRLWAQEVFSDCRFVCVTTDPTWANVNAKAAHVNPYIQHHARLAFGQGRPNGTKQARIFFDRAYMSLLNGFWRNDVFHTEGFSLDLMKRLVGLQTYADRSWSSNHPYPDRRIGFAWNQAIPAGLPANEEQHLRNQYTALAQRLARSVQGAFGSDGVRQKACNPGGNDPTGCNPTSGGSFNNNWDIFRYWSP
jgi:hypothetical protein